MLELFTENMEYVDFITSSRSMLSVYGVFDIITDKYTLLFSCKGRLHQIGAKTNRKCLI